MSQLLKLEIVNGKARQKIIDPTVDSFAFKEITIGGVTLTEETVDGLSFEALDTVRVNLEAEVEALEVQTALNLSSAIATVEAEIQAESDEADAIDARLVTAEASLAAIIANNPDQYIEKVVGASKNTFTVSGFSFDPLNTVLDVEVYVNGMRFVQCVAGDFSTGSFKKNSSTVIQLQDAAPENSEIVIWRQGTSSAGTVIGGGGGDLSAISQDLAPSVNGGQSIGLLTHAFSGIYLKDQVSSQVYLLRVVSGVFEVVEVPE